MKTARIISTVADGVSYMYVGLSGVNDQGWVVYGQGFECNNTLISNHLQEKQEEDKEELTDLIVEESHLKSTLGVSPGRNKKKNQSQVA